MVKGIHTTSFYLLIYVTISYLFSAIQRSISEKHKCIIQSLLNFDNFSYYMTIIYFSTTLVLQCFHLKSPIQSLLSSYNNNLCILMSIQETGSYSNVMLGQRRRRWPNITLHYTTLKSHLVCSGVYFLYNWCMTMYLWLVYLIIPL